MIPYWLLFLVPSMAALSSAPRYRGVRRVSLDPAWIGVIVLLVVFVGFRFEVGGDWFNYVGHVEYAEEMSLSVALREAEPLYWAVAVLSAQSGIGVFGVTITASFLFSVGLAYLCRTLPRPYLALAVAVPYLVIVVSMGYVRQSMALGLVLLGIIALCRGSMARFVFWVVLGTLFPKSAILMLPLGALTLTRNRYLNIMLVLIAGALGYAVLLDDEVDRLVQHYIEAEYQSAGALIRLIMNALPAALFLMFRKRFRLGAVEYRFWRLLSLLSLVLLAGYFLTSASTALDRIALYCIPLQLFVFAHLPDVLGRHGSRNMPVVAAILAYYATVQFVWLSYSQNAYMWLPYDNLI